jgi:hypothetical protein
VLVNFKLHLLQNENSVHVPLFSDTLITFFLDKNHYGMYDKFNSDLFEPESQLEYILCVQHLPQLVLNYTGLELTHKAATKFNKYKELYKQFCIILCYIHHGIQINQESVELIRENSQLSAFKRCYMDEFYSLIATLVSWCAAQKGMDLYGLLVQNNCNHSSFKRTHREGITDTITPKIWFACLFFELEMCFRARLTHQKRNSPVCILQEYQSDVLNVLTHRLEIPKQLKGLNSDSVLDQQFSEFLRVKCRYRCYREELRKYVLKQHGIHLFSPKYSMLEQSIGKNNN